MTVDPTHPNVYPSADDAAGQNIDKTPPSANTPPVQRPAADAAAEAVRTGREDQSAHVGAQTPDEERMATGEPTTVGDPDAMTEQAKVVGEEAVGGTTPTPDQSNVDDIAASAGINTKAEHPVNVKREMDRRDEHRYELDPESKGPAASA